MSDISVRTKLTLGQDDQRWIGNGGEPIGKPRSIVLDRSGFDLVTNFPNGFIPSGVTLAKITATGLYVPYAGTASEVQTLTRTSTGGTITLAFDGSAASATIPATAAGFTAAATQTALEGLSTINPGDVTVTGAAGGPLTVTFGGRYLGQNVPQLVVDNTSATGGTIVAATTTAGGSAASNGSQTALGHLFAAVAYDRDSTGDIAGALFWNGEVDESFLPTNHGLDATAKAQLTHIAYV